MRYEDIPEERRAEVRNLIEGNDIIALLRIHDEYKLTDYKYGCCNADGMMAFFKAGLKEGLI